MLEASVDSRGGSVGGARPVEVGQDVVGATGQGGAELAQLAQAAGTLLARASMTDCICSRALTRSGAR